MPYTDSMGNITSISIKSTDSGMFVITGGGEGVIRVWKFDVTKLCFELFAAPMEGHLRQVTSLLLVGK